MQPSKHVPRELKKQLDRLFAELGSLDKRIAAVNADYERDTKGLTEIYADQLAPLEADHKAHAKALKALIKDNADILFEAPGADGCQAITCLGKALRQTGEKLKTSRQTLVLCEDQGFDVVKVVKSLDRAKLAKYPLEKLVLVEAEKRPFIDYGYELREASNGSK